MKKSIELFRYVIGTLLLSTTFVGRVDVALSDDLQITKGHGLEARTLIRASSRIEYRTEINAPVSSTNFLAGDTFNEGDLLIAFDCSRYEAERRAAQSSAKAAAIEFQSKRKLLKYKAAGKTEVDLAAAQAEQAKAELEVHTVRNESCSFEAPFSGRVVELNAEVHEYPPANEPLMIIINDTKLEMELVVPSKWLVWLRTGVEFDIAIDETGETGTGRVERIAAEVDPVSQTVKLVAAFTEKPRSVLAGMSGTVHFSAKLN